MENWEIGASLDEVCLVFKVEQFTLTRLLLHSPLLSQDIPIPLTPIPVFCGFNSPRRITDNALGECVANVETRHHRNVTITQGREWMFTALKIKVVTNLLQLRKFCFVFLPSHRLCYIVFGDLKRTIHHHDVLTQTFS